MQQPMIVDDQDLARFEPYGPHSCPLYKAGPTRKVPGRKGMNWEEDGIDRDAVSHRGPED